MLSSFIRPMMAVLAFCGLLKAAPPEPAYPPAPLERGEIVRLYMDGKYDTLAALLEKIRWERRMRNKDDSVFVFKFLGAIYGEEKSTRKKAESFLYGMLKLNPLENLGGLGASDTVEALFKKVRTVYASLHKPAPGGATPGPSSQRSLAPSTPSLVVTEDENSALEPAK